MNYQHACPFKKGDTVRIPASPAIPIDQRIGTVTKVKRTEQDYNLVTFRYDDGNEIILEDFSKKYKIDDTYKGNAMSLVGNPKAVKIENYIRFYRHVFVRNNRTGKVTQQHESKLLKWYL